MLTSTFNIPHILVLTQRPCANKAKVYLFLNFSSCLYAFYTNYLDLYSFDFSEPCWLIWHFFFYYGFSLCKILKKYVWEICKKVWYFAHFLLLQYILYTDTVQSIAHILWYATCWSRDISILISSSSIALNNVLGSLNVSCVFIWKLFHGLFLKIFVL